MAWIDCGQDFIEGDVIRWTEEVTRPSPWGPRGGRIKAGDRVIIAQVITDSRNLAGEVELRAIQSEGKYALKPDEIFVRRRRAFGYRDVERMAWSDEDARTCVLESTAPLQEGPACYGGDESGHVLEESSAIGGRSRGEGQRSVGPVWGRRQRKLRPTI